MRHTLLSPGCGQGADSPLRARRDKSTQRERLLAAIVTVSCEHGYEDTTIARVIGRAGVSRPTFYEHFARKEACFLAALENVQRDVLSAATLSIEDRPPQNAAAAAISALVSFARERPVDALFLTNETMAAGRQALDARDEGVREIARLIENAHRRVSAGTLVPALPGEILIGATYRLLASRLAHGDHELAALQTGLLDWIAGYESPAGERKWRSLTPAATPARSPLLRRAPLRPPPALGPGRPRRFAAEVSENQRLRIIFATAEIVRRDGYAATSVAEITRAASVDGRVFYQLFAGKQDAFAAVREFMFQHAMAVTAGAFFAAGDWPRRVWEAGAAFTQYLQDNPVLTHACVVESHAGGTETETRLQDLIAGFTIFLQEGYEYQPRRGATTSRVALEAVAQASFEIVYRQVRSSASPDISGLLAHLAHISLTPFVGAAKAGELIEQLTEDGTS